MRQRDLDCIRSCLQTLHELSEAWVPAGRYWRSVARKFAGRVQSGEQVAMLAHPHEDPASADPEYAAGHANVEEFKPSTSAESQESSQISSDQISNWNMDVPSVDMIDSDYDSLPWDYMFSEASFNWQLDSEAMDAIQD